MYDFQLCDPAYVTNALPRVESHQGCVILEAHFTSIDHPLDLDLPVRHHIPGAIQMHPSYLEAGTNVEKYYPFYDCPEDGNLLPHPELTRMLEDLGILPDTTVIVYGTEPDGPMAAARIAWGLLYAGVKQVRLLDGGLDVWLDSGGAIAMEIAKAVDVAHAGQARESATSPWIARPECLATSGLVQAVSDDPTTASARLVDVRNAGEWDGSCLDYYSFFSNAGHIPNSHFQGNWEILLEEDSGKIGPVLEEVERYWRDLGIVESEVERNEKELIFYCGTGWRSSLAFLVATLLGFSARNYDDGFYGWSWSDENQVSRDDAPCRATVGTGKPC